MKRIDFIGLPGVGKSTIVNNVVENNSNQNIVTFDDQLFKVLRMEYLKNRYSIKSIISVLISLLYDKRKDLLRLDKEKYYEDVSEGIYSKLNVVNWFLSNYKPDNSEVFMQPYRVYWLIKLLEEITIMEKSSINQNLSVLFDESLTNRLVTQADDLNSLHKLLEHSNELMPDAFIYLKLNKELVKERLSTRSRVTVSHLFSSQSANKQKWDSLNNKFEEVSTFLLDRGCKGLVVDTSKSIGECKSEVEAFLNKLEQ